MSTRAEAQAFYDADGEHTFDVHYMGGKPGHTFTSESVDRVCASIKEFILAQQAKRWDEARATGGLTPTSAVITVKIDISGSPRAEAG